VSAARGVLLHGEWWDVTTLDQATRQEMSRHIEGLQTMDVCRSSTTGPDVFDEDALVVLIVLDSFEVLQHYRSQPEYKSMAEYIGPLGLYPDKMVQFNIEMPVGAASLTGDHGLVLHGCQVDASEADEDARTEIVARMRDLGEIELVRAATEGPDLVASNMISQAMFLDGVDALQKCLEHERYSAMTSSIASRQLPKVSFSLKLRGAPW